MKSTALTAEDKMPFRSPWELILQRIGLLIFILIVLGPLLVLIAQVIPALSAGHTEWLKLMLPTGHARVICFGVAECVFAIMFRDLLLRAL